MQPQLKSQCDSQPSVEHDIFATEYLIPPEIKTTS